MRALFVVLVVMSACVTDELELSETEQPVTWTITTYLNCSNGCPNTQLGDADAMTCFLAGVQGQLAPLGGSATAEVSVFISPVSHKWEIHAQGVEKVGATCIATTAGRITGKYAKNHGDTFIGSVAGNRRCFLSSISWSPKGAPSFGDEARLYLDHGYWHITTSLVNSPSASDAFAGAVCVNVPVYVGSYSFSHNTTGSVSSVFATVVNSGGCGLTAVNGIFSGLPHPGVRVNSTVPTQWSWTYDERVGGTAACVQPF